MQPTSKNSELVFGASVKKIPLLPFEKDLINTIGCSEEEYRNLVLEGIKRAKTRPSGYELIPDIEAKGAVTAFFINLAVSLIITGINNILNKPKKPPANRLLDSETGPSRFLATSGFETEAQVATFLDPVPIIFGKYDTSSKIGGMLVAPTLVWSRMFSYGLQQGVKLMFAVGEEGKGELVKPDLEGIFIGTGALDSIYEDTFAFYWKGKSSSGHSRIKSSNLEYGTRGGIDKGDTENIDDVFSCPTNENVVDKAFCSTRGLTNNQDFGMYAAIPNGTPYRINWRVVSIPRDADKRWEMTYQRVKISGDENGYLPWSSIRKRAGGMGGCGRNYTRRMGITKVHTTKLPSNGAKFAELNIQIGQTIEFTIKAGTIDKIYKDTVTVDDINSELNQQRIAADDVLQVGEIFQIGETTFQVTNRRLSQWTITSGDQIITLKCIEVDKGTGRPKVGIVNEKLLIADYIKDQEGVVWDSAGPDPTDSGSIPNTDFFPLARVSTGIVRNQRPVDSTEIGIRSRVYQKLNGICNFQSLPSPAKLQAFDYDKLNIQSGNITKYIQRTSVFSIYLREIGTSKWLLVSGNENEVGNLFCVRGSDPTVQYNSIRFVYPERKAYEFKFVPRAASFLTQLSNSTNIIVLNSTKPEISGNVYFGIQAVVNGEKLTISQILSNDELTNTDIASGLTTTVTSTTTTEGTSYTLPTSVGFRSFLQEAVSATNVTAVSYYKIESNSSNYERNGNVRTAVYAWAYQKFGDASNSGTRMNGYKTFLVNESVSGNRTLEMEYTCRRTALPFDDSADIKFSGITSTSNRFFVTEHRFPSYSSWEFYWEDWDPNQVSGTNPVVGTPAVTSSSPQKYEPIETRYGGDRIHNFPSKEIGLDIWTVEPSGGASRGVNDVQHEYSQKSGIPGAHTYFYKIKKTTNNQHFARDQVDSAWYVTDYKPVGNSLGNWTNGEIISLTKSISSTNPFRNDPAVSGSLSSVTFKLKVTGTSVSDRSETIDQGWYYEIFGNPSSYRLGTTRRITKTITSPKTIRIRLIAKSMDKNDRYWPDDVPANIHRGWKDFRVEVLTDGSTSQNWSRKDEFLIEENVSNSNPWTGSTHSKLTAKFRIDSVRQITIEGESITTTQEIPRAAERTDRAFEDLSQVSDISFYANLIEKSNANEPEHTLVYVNEITKNPDTPTYENMATAGLALKASRRFSSLDQMRVWLSEGIKVKLHHPSDSGFGSSNLLTDLFYYLLSDNTAGVGGILGNNDSLINTKDLEKTSKFLRINNLFFNGSITKPVNIRQYITKVAPNFLCNFVLSEGKLSLIPAVPVTPNGNISTSAITVKQLFTSGNILEDSFELNYLNGEEREPFKAELTWRENEKNQLPKKVVTTVQYADSPEKVDIESFDLSEYVCSEEHARMVGKYFLALRKHVTHTITFKTAAFGLDLKCGNYIKVVTESSPYNAANNGVISSTGVISSARNLPNGQYRIIYFINEADKDKDNEIEDAILQVDDMTTSDSNLFNTVFSIQSTTKSQNIYLIEQLTIEEDNTVSIVASEFPCNTNSVSRIALDLISDKEFSFNT